MKQTKFPTGIQGFGYLRKQGFYYVDKTAYIDRLLQDRRKHFFLSRPRRFGKSLFVSTMKEAFEGNEELFRGLVIHDKWDWSVRRPVIRLDYSGGYFCEPGAVARITNECLEEAETIAGLESSESDPAVRLRKLIRKLYAQTKQEVVLLVDEYDKPILGALKDPERAVSNRDQLQGIYGVLKQTEDYVRFSFFTGVSRFSKTSLFSGVNNLNDITLTPEYSSICGYTESDLDNVFGSNLDGLCRDKIRLWYNGYSWLGKDKVYNPQAILQLLVTRKFDEWWYETGSPTFLVDVLNEQPIFSVNIGHDTVSQRLLSNFDIDSIEILALLFQAGYLTITETMEVGDETQHRLDYPNLEVRRSLNRLLECSLLPKLSKKKQNNKSNKLRKLLENCDVSGLGKHFKSLFAGIPHQWYDNSPVSDYEAHCASVFFSHLTGANLDITAETSTSKGRVDLVINLESRVYLFEFKISKRKSAKSAIKQMRDKGYAEKFRIQGVPIHLVAVEYNSKARNIIDFRVEDL